MDKNARAIVDKRIKRTMENLKANNMQPYYVETVKDVAGKVAELLKEGDIVAVGGSMSLFEAGIIDLLRCGKYTFLDRYEEGLSREQMKQIFRKSFFADVYLSSSNAITENGELYNVDGNSNRVAAICYGPDSVIIVVGINKIVRNLDEAVRRVKTMAAPANATRLDYPSYCREKGECMGLNSGDSCMTSGCGGQNRICCNYVVSAYQNQKDRIKVIIVGEELGY